MSHSEDEIDDSNDNIVKLRRTVTWAVNRASFCVSPMQLSCRQLLPMQLHRKRVSQSRDFFVNVRFSPCSLRALKMASSRTFSLHLIRSSETSMNWYLNVWHHNPDINRSLFKFHVYVNEELYTSKEHGTKLEFFWRNGFCMKITSHLVWKARLCCAVLCYAPGNFTQLNWTVIMSR